MGKKNAGERKKKSRKHVQKLLDMDLESRSRFFEVSPATELLRVVEESYLSDLVNIWLDLKKSVVRDLFQKLVKQRKRLVLPAIALYCYKGYLTNPLPLDLRTESGDPIPNYYAMVGLPRSAELDQVREAHRLLQQAYSEDAFPPSEREMARKKLTEIDVAFSILKSEKKRQEVDRRLPNIHYYYPSVEQAWLESVKRY